MWHKYDENILICYVTICDVFMHALKNTNNFEVYDSGKLKSSIFTIVGM